MLQCPRHTSWRFFMQCREESHALAVGNARRQQLLRALTASEHPITGAELAVKCGVTRQVVVHDIALLRTAGFPILSTPRGYLLSTSATGTNQYVISVNHPPTQTEQELLILVDHGVTVIDVIVEHPLYGELRGALQLSSRMDVESFMEQVRTCDAQLLSSLTDGYHLHTVQCQDVERLRRAIHALRAAGIDVTAEI
jgi:transcriptional regulator of NAD metabolism